MIAFISYFFPAVVGLWLFEVLKKENLSVKRCIYRFCGYTLLCNLSCFVVKKFLLGTADAALVVGQDMLPAVSLNYLTIALPIVILFVLCEVLFGKKIRIDVEKKDEE